MYNCSHEMNDGWIVNIVFGRWAENGVGLSYSNATCNGPCCAHYNSKAYHVGHDGFESDPT